MRYIITALIVLLTFNETIACKCIPIDSASVKKISNEFDYLIIGRAFKNVSFNSELNKLKDKKKGYDVLIEVDSVLKGNLQSKILIIKQHGGNCNQIFRFGEQYLIFGYKIEEFVNSSSKRSRDEQTTSFQSPPPKPPSIRNRKVYSFDLKQEEIDYWNNLAMETLIINTSMCSSFTIDSQVAEYFR